MTVPTHSVKHVRNKYRIIQLLAAFFATLTIAAAFLAAASGLQATLLKKKQLPSTAQLPSSDIQKEIESDQKINSLNTQLTAEKAATQALRQKVTKLERRLATIQKAVSPANITQSVPEAIPVPKKVPAPEKAKPNLKLSPVKSAPSTIKPSTTPSVQPIPNPQVKPEPAQVPKSMPVSNPDPVPAPKPKPAIKPEPTPAPKPPVATPKPATEPKAVPAPKPEPIKQPIPAPTSVPETPEIKSLPEKEAPKPVSQSTAPSKPAAAAPQSMDPDRAGSLPSPGEQSLVTEEISSSDTRVQP